MITRLGRIAFCLALLGTLAVRSNASVGFGVSIVTAGPYHIGQQVTINWTAPAGQPLYDWIGVVPAGTPTNTGGVYNEDHFRSWFFTGGGTSGSGTLDLPLTAGNYEVRYFLQNTFNTVATTGSFAVDNAGYPLTVTSAGHVVNGDGTWSIGGGDSLTVSWTAPLGRSAVDWIGLFKVGDPNTAYTVWTYTGGATSGSKTFTAPNTNGDYEFRYLFNDKFISVPIPSVTIHIGWTVAVTSPVGGGPYTAGDPLTISWTAPQGHAATDYIAIFKTGTADNADLSFKTVGTTATSGTVILPAPDSVIPGGTYEARYLTSASGIEGISRATSPTFNTTGRQYSVTPVPNHAPSAGSTTVSWTAPYGSSTLDWIALFKVGDPNTAYIAGTFFYTGGARTGSHIVTVPVGTVPGSNYEFRYLLNDGYVGPPSDNSTTPFTVDSGN